MPFTQSQILDIKSLIKEAMQEFMSNDRFIDALATKVAEKIPMQEITDKINLQAKHINDLQNKVDYLQTKLNLSEQRYRNQSVRIYGLSGNTASIDLESIVSKTLSDRMGIDLTSANIDQCYRLGKFSDDRRAVLLKLSNEKLKKLIMSKKKLLKGTGVVVAEDLTSQTYKLFKDASNKLGKSKVWTADGNIFAKVGSSVYKIKSISDIDRINSGT